MIVYAVVGLTEMMNLNRSPIAGGGSVEAKPPAKAKKYVAPFSEAAMTLAAVTTSKALVRIGASEKPTTVYAEALLIVTNAVSVENGGTTVPPDSVPPVPAARV